jgi:hypothetical protein
MSLYQFGSVASGLQFEINAIPDGQGGTTFSVHVITGSLNLNALYWGDGDATAGESFKEDFNNTKSENALNMNGDNVVWNDDGTSTTSKEVYDGGIKLSDAGLGHGDGSTFLSADGTSDYVFTVDGLDMSLFETLGVRATSTSTAGGSIKWVDEDPSDPPPPPDSFAFDGLSQGAWKTIDADGNPIGAGDWANTNFSPTDGYEATFGVANTSLGTDNAIEDGKTLLDSFSASGSEGALAKQATAALLNSDSSGETTLTQDYRFPTDQIMGAVQEVYDDGAFDPVQAADLKAVLEFWNTAPENNTGVGATVDGELHSEDTTAIAQTLEYNGLDGGSFTGSLIDVLADLHPDHGWIA